MLSADILKLIFRIFKLLLQQFNLVIEEAVVLGLLVNGQMVIKEGIDQFIYRLRGNQPDLCAEI